ncbi:MAG: 4-(cytidine 5'-diphospho)-2-C-methyl-D-erythritol kinase, partial [Alphaproteobacteria bacterium]|nr:4-(cytidine 5'-diphospho)-2-C-methyl-D-erythritol kinase [Alphaproteobacteria bacterium]
MGARMTLTAVIELAPAKINLFLHVGDKRDDGYHELDSLVAFAGEGDKLGFESGKDLSLEVEGPFAGELEGGENNLVLKAANLLAKSRRIKGGARIR